jgi:hypothetical protein
MKTLQLRFQLALALLSVLAAGVLSLAYVQDDQTLAEGANALGTAAQVVIESAEAASDVASFLPGSFK